MMEKLPRRERELFELLCGLGEATSEQLREVMPDPPGNSATRALLARMERRGAVAHRVDGTTYVYRPVSAPRMVAGDLLRRIVKTHFGGSIASAATLLLGDATAVGSDELDAIEAAIHAARQRK